MKIGPTVKKWQQFFEIQDGGCRQKSEFEDSKSRKGTCTKQNTSFEP